MVINKAEFVTSAVKREQYPKERLPCIVMVGKSNVGKSSIINTLANNSKLARISSQPGKTRLINFYKINDSFYIVDLPGYGFAKVSRRERQKWARMIEGFFNSEINLASIIHILDIRHKPTDDDAQMMDWINYYKIPVIVVANKADKLGKTRWQPQIAKIREHLKLPSHISVLTFSVQNKMGVKALLDYIEDSLAKYQNPRD